MISIFELNERLKHLSTAISIRKEEIRSLNRFISEHEKEICDIKTCIEALHRKEGLF